MLNQSWQKLVLAVVEDRPGLWETIAEWAGLHYGASMQHMSKEHQVEWCMRFIEQEGEASLTPAAETGAAWVTLSWVYPDEDGGSVEAAVNLSTGLVTAIEPVPDDIRQAEVRVRIESEHFESDMLDVQATTRHGQALWQVGDDDMEELRASLTGKASAPSQ
jgi:hypothetical protein